MKKESSKSVEATIAELMKENVRHRNDIEQTKLDFDRRFDEIGADLIQILDAFEKAEERIRDRGLDQEESSQKAIKQLLLAKRKTEAIMDKYKIKKIVFPEGMADDNLCVIVNTSPDSNRKEGEIVAIEKEGYLREGRLIRRAEVEIVKN